MGWILLTEVAPASPALPLINTNNRVNVVDFGAVGDAVATNTSAIQNAIKHAEAKNIRIDLTVAHEKVVVNIIDDGIGFTEPKMADGLGMRNMKHRTKLLGGTIWWSSEGKGSSVTIELPFKENE